MDAVQKAGNGHPGTAMALAPVAHHLFQHVMVHDPNDPHWIGRDRFILSLGHSSLTLYLQLFLCGYGLEMDDIKQLRQWGSLTPGHPEWQHTAGVETTTGPLGQGIGNGVGMALAARHERYLLDPTAANSIFDHRIWVLASDGDIEEGVSAEASSFAGRQELGLLNVIYDDNQITIDGPSSLSLSEDVAGRYLAYGWHVQTVDRAANGDVDLPAFAAACEAATLETAKPSLIVLKTTIAWPAPSAQNTSASHGSALGADEIAATKVVLGFDPEQHFAIDDDVLTHTRQAMVRGAQIHNEWNLARAEWETAHPEQAALLARLESGELPANWSASLPTFEIGTQVATRKASGAVINALAGQLPELWGGSADLGESNNTHIKGADHSMPATPAGANIAFGIREHAMGSIMNGIALHGRSKVFGGTFLVFSDYMRPAVRLAGLMGLPVTYVWTHDSIGVGEDGPTHQPIEHLAALRAIPNLNVIRPADANETAAAWQLALTSESTPTALILTRQDVPVLDRSSATTTNDASDPLTKGAYTISPADNPEVILMATGSEVTLALQAQEALKKQGVAASVVSMPCVEIFREQPQAYRDEVLPPSVRARVSIEAGITPPWREFVGDGGRSIGIDHYGASANGSTLYREFGITVEAVVEQALAARDQN
jgi:transketolase